MQLTPNFLRLMFNSWCLIDNFFQFQEYEIIPQVFVTPCTFCLYTNREQYVQWCCLNDQAYQLWTQKIININNCLFSQMSCHRLVGHRLIQTCKNCFKNHNWENPFKQFSISTFTWIGKTFIYLKIISFLSKQNFIKKSYCSLISYLS